MGVDAIVVLLADAIHSAQLFIEVFASVYGLLILIYIILSWVRLPYSIWLNRMQQFLRDVVEPYLGLFRRLLPPLGALDLSPIVAIFVLFLVERLIVGLLGRFH